MERCSNTTKQILSQESHTVVQILTILKAIGHSIIGARVLYDKAGCPIGSCTTLIKSDGLGNLDKLFLLVRVDTDDPQGMSLDVDLLNATNKRDRGRQAEMEIPHHNYIKDTNR